MNTDILEYTLAKFRETNDFGKHFDRIAFHQYCVDEAIGNKDVDSLDSYQIFPASQSKIALLTS